MAKQEGEPDSGFRKLEEHFGPEDLDKKAAEVQVFKANALGEAITLSAAK